MNTTTTEAAAPAPRLDDEAVAFAAAAERGKTNHCNC